MNKGNSRGRIVADTTALADHCRIPQLANRNIGKRNVDRLACDVLAFARLSATRAPEHIVRTFRTVTADHMNRHLGAKFLVHLPNDVDGVGIDLCRNVLAPIAHEPVDLLHRLGNELAAPLVGHGELFFGMDVIERNRARLVARPRPGDDRSGHKACNHDLKTANQMPIPPRRGYQTAPKRPCPPPQPPSTF